jgi:putative transposase
VLVSPVSDRLKTLLMEKADELEATISSMEIMPDHVHLLVQCDPQFGIHRVVRHLKGYSSRILRTEFSHLKSRLPSLWTNSYLVSTVGTVSLDVVKQYIEAQKGRVR